MQAMKQTLTICVSNTSFLDIFLVKDKLCKLNIIFVLTESHVCKFCEGLKLQYFGLVKGSVFTIILFISPNEALPHEIFNRDVVHDNIRMIFTSFAVQYL